MPTQSYPYSDHEHPQYVTLAYLEAFEGRMINRIESHFSEMTVELTAIKGRLDGIDKRFDALPTSWMFFVFVFSTMIPLYGILAALLWTTVRH